MSPLGPVGGPSPAFPQPGHRAAQESRHGDKRALGQWVKADNDDQLYKGRKEAFYWILTKKHDILKNTLYLLKITLEKKV